MAAPIASRLSNFYHGIGTYSCSLLRIRHPRPMKTVINSCYSDETNKRGLPFDDKRVQALLKGITGLDLEKVFRPQKKNLKPPTYTLISEKRLRKMRGRAVAEAKELLRMPPVLEEREEIHEVLSDDKTLQGLETSNIVFTDISYGLSERERLVVVREPSGTLRKATWDERDRMMQIYFPRPNRQIQPPPLFEDENLQHVLDQGRYEHLLDAACVQFEPDNANFIRVHRRVYDHINQHHQYDALRSTRHFGGMVFYLVKNKKVEPLMAEMMETNLLSDAADLVRLYRLIHPESKTAGQEVLELDDLGMVQMFVAMDAKDKGKLELLIQQYEAQMSNQPDVQQ